MGLTSVGLVMTQPIWSDGRPADEAHDSALEEPSSELQKNSIVISPQTETSLENLHYLLACLKLRRMPRYSFFFSLGCRFGRVYTIPAPFTLELKWLLAFSLMMGQLLFIMIGSQYQNLHSSNKKPKTQSNSVAQPKSQTKTCSLETLVFKFLKFLFVWNVLFTLPPHLPAIFTWLIPSHSSDLSLNISFLIICFHTTMRLFFMALTIIWNHTFIFFQKPYMYFCVYLTNICLPHWM